MQQRQIAECSCGQRYPKPDRKWAGRRKMRLGTKFQPKTPQWPFHEDRERWSKTPGNFSIDTTIAKRTSLTGRATEMEVASKAVTKFSNPITAKIHHSCQLGLHSSCLSSFKSTESTESDMTAAEPRLRRTRMRSQQKTKPQSDGHKETTGPALSIGFATHQI